MTTIQSYAVIDLIVAMLGNHLYIANATTDAADGYAASPQNLKV